MANLIFRLCLFPLTLVFSTLCWLCVGLGKNNAVSHRLECLWGRLVLLCGGIRVTADLSALAPGATYVFFANHQSNLDIPALFSVLSGYNFRFLAKDSLFRIPVFGPAMARVGHVAIERENRRKAMESIARAVEMVSSGVGLLIFPEGTRSTDFSTLGQFKTGGMIVALKCRCPVAPLIVTGSGRILPKGARRLRSGTIRITALPPVDVSRYTLKDRDAFKQDMETLMRNAYLEHIR
ncbi:lysophospholipid acyltransferase family protein [Desulfolutivibrio sulfoxidireducens]|uniref:lysophospholipid acyltransferase family protein n=1 Tax=Desulfolutivibrio sulfoxidireducens TaxID=2773299 RepID=UPI00159D627F|nr:lysophospholipid acyltransferase family protein [Desulfolutivibrio sulfoxidireducens]QLA17173.1 1-acyl-sn-glycerol-3-phosphate acyltransferase [Desulfolutivibrio sulfoxidireducens]